MDLVILITVVIYFLIMLLVGFWANRRTKSSKDFLVAGQSLGFFVMAIATFSSIQSGWGMFGTTGTVYGWGIQAVIATGIITPIGFFLSWTLLGTKLRRIAQYHEVYSVPDIIRVRYGSRAAHITMSVAMFIGSIGYMTSQITAMGFIMSLLFDTSFITGAWIGSIIVAIYTIAGGMLAAVWTDLIQGVLMVGMSLAVFIVATANAGGWGGMLNSIAAENPEFTSLMGIMPITWIFSAAIMIIFGSAGQPQLITKFLMLRDEKELRWGALTASVAYAITTLFSIGVGLAVRALVIEGSVPALDNIDNVTTQFLGSEDLINPVLGGLALTALLAAIMSSASSFITIGASSIMRDLASAFNIQVKRDLLWGRIYSAVIVLLSLLFGLYLDQIIYLLGAIGWSAFGAATFGPIVLGIYWKRATGIATTISIILGLVFNLVATILTANGIITVPEYFHIGGITLIAGMLIFIVLSYVTSSADDQEKFENMYLDNHLKHKTEVAVGEVK
ncbi:sodium:solute symporter family transporter [Pseudalkalibacillus decolorationis]|uniref:sodium:solute symporter family transporter n=1 Tax=Pseudalkalibacillus decolorationis TaxID=163879 RepID=UPI002148BE3E|nr:hypothetical protein [Pseudalkalibacillus decolorationis]